MPGPLGSQAAPHMAHHHLIDPRGMSVALTLPVPEYSHPSHWGLIIAPNDPHSSHGSHPSAKVLSLPCPLGPVFYVQLCPHSAPCPSMCGHPLCVPMAVSLGLDMDIDILGLLGTLLGLFFKLCLANKTCCIAFCLQ